MIPRLANLDLHSRFPFSAGALGVGALAIGNVKYRTESGLFQQMTESKTPLRLDFRQAFELARTLA